MISLLIPLCTMASFQVLDTDADGIADSIEDTYGLDKSNPDDAAIDSDKDGLSNLSEVITYFSDPKAADTDFDGLSDGLEVELGSSLQRKDSDGDTMPDAWEHLNGLALVDASDAGGDLDNDGVANINEYLFGTDPNDKESKPQLKYTDRDNAFSWQLSLGDEGNGGQHSYFYFYSHNNTKLTFDTEGRHYGYIDAFTISIDGEVVYSDHGRNSVQHSFDLEVGLHKVEFSVSLNTTDDVWLSDFYILINNLNIDFNPIATQGELTEYWLEYYGLDREEDLPSLDKDGDGLSNLDEMNNGTSPIHADTDGDGVTDGVELSDYEISPLEIDSDRDGMPDGYEVNNGTLPYRKDADADYDNDSFTNLVEYQFSSNPTDFYSRPPAVGYFSWNFDDGVRPSELTDGYPDIYAFDPSDADWFVIADKGNGILRSGYISRSNGATIDSSVGHDNDVEPKNMSFLKLHLFMEEGTFSFDYNVEVGESEAKGVLIHNEERHELSGEGSFTVNVLKGEHTFYFLYDKDRAEMGFASNDVFSIDNLNFISPLVDSDDDGLTNQQEVEIGTAPLVLDTDGDGLSDGDEVNAYKTDPLAVDTDSDGVSDGDEINKYKTDPLVAAGSNEKTDEKSGGGIWLLLGSIIFLVRRKSQLN